MDERVDEKPNGRSLGWERLETDYPYGFRMFRVRRDKARWPNGKIAPYVYVEAAGAVWVVPVLEDGRIVLIRQFRYIIDDWSWEVPAGGFHDFDGGPIELAKKELAEEVGGRSDDWTYVSAFRPGLAIIDEVCHVVMAHNVQLDRPPRREPGEIIEVHPVSVERALEMARMGEIVDGHSALALLQCESILRGWKDGAKGGSS